jgi:biotin transporter BioY
MTGRVNKLHRLKTPGGVAALLLGLMGFLSRFLVGHRAFPSMIYFEHAAAGFVACMFAVYAGLRGVRSERVVHGFDVDNYGRACTVVLVFSLFWEGWQWLSLWLPKDMQAAYAAEKGVFQWDQVVADAVGILIYAAVSAWLRRRAGELGTSPTVQG